MLVFASHRRPRLSCSHLLAVGCFVLAGWVGAGCGKDTTGSQMSAGDDDDDGGGTGSADDASDDPATPGDDDDDTGTGTADDANSCVPGVDDCEAGFKCQPYVKEDGACCVDADQCVPVVGDKEPGEACTRERYSDDCRRDAFCHCGTSGKEGAGFCKQLCDGTNPDSCADLGMPDAICIPYNDGKLPTCEVPCHPLRPVCNDGLGCYASANIFVCARPDPEPGKGKPGDDCYTVQSCNPGGACIYADNLEGCASDSCCSPFCDVTGDGSACTAPHTCVAWYAEDDAEADPQLTDVGFCGLADDGG